ncbi:MAG: lysine--tRNA ligase [Metamycoplasmataceae bacterium]
MRNFSEQEIIRREKVKKFEENSLPCWTKKKEITHTIKELKSQYDNFSKEELHNKLEKISTYGKIMSKRGPFTVLFNDENNIQIYINNKEEKILWEFISLLDIGDIVWVEGFVMKTLTNELAIKTKEMILLSKSLKVLPEKYHGLVNVEERYRHRYVDLISNEEVRKIFRQRTLIIKEIRNFFDERDYLEVDTPILSPFLSGASAKPFITHHNALNKDFYLRIATELPLKKLLVGGFNKVYEIGRLFRNEGIDTTHNPEFTTIEFYESNSDMWEMMDYTEKLIQQLASKLGIKTVSFKEHEIDLSQKFQKIEMCEAISKIVNFDVKNSSFETLKKEAQKRNFKIEPFFEKGHLINLFFEELVEPTLIQPTFVYGHPIEISPFAFKSKENPNFTERAELFIGTKEYANMFSELNDPIDQLNRFELQLKEKENGNDEANEIDWDFVEALEYAMPPAGGCGIGIDRLVMLLTKQTSIREVLLFPHLKNK